MVHSPAPPSVQYFLPPYCLFLGYGHYYPPAVYLSQLVGLSESCSSWLDNGRHCPCSRTPSHGKPPCSIWVRPPRPPIQWMTLYQTAYCGLPPACPLTDYQWWLAHVALACQIGHQRQAGIQGMQVAFQDFLHPLPCPPLKWNFIWASAFFSALQRQVNYFSTLSVAPDTMSSSIRFDMLKKLAMTFRLVIIVYRISELLLLLTQWNLKFFHE